MSSKSAEFLLNARMSYATTIIVCVTYGMYFVLAGICLHFLMRRRSGACSQRILLVYTSVMLLTTSAYVFMAIVWSGIEFIESSDVAEYDIALSSRLTVAKNSFFTINIWLADSLLTYRLFVIWGGSVLVVATPCILWLATVATGIGLLVFSAQPDAQLTSPSIINFQTSFYCLTVSLNLFCTLFIAGRLWYHHQAMQRFKATSKMTYTPLIAVLVESAALYSICGVIFIPLTVRKMPLQLPFSAMIGGLTCIAPNLIILRMALGTAASAETGLLSTTYAGSTDIKLSSAAVHSRRTGASRMTVSASSRRDTAGSVGRIPHPGAGSDKLPWSDSSTELHSKLSVDAKAVALPDVEYGKFGETA